MSTATIRLDHLQLCAVTARMRRLNGGRTCQLAALSAYPTIDLDCSRGRAPSQSTRDAASHHGISPARCRPLDRGHMVSLMERVQLMHGGREVRKTWGAGIRALQNEGSKYVLQGGAA